MILLDEVIKCESRSDRFELYPIGDAHIGKRNCAEEELRKQVAEIVRRSHMPNRTVRAVLGGDQMDIIKPQDIRRFNFRGLAEWFFIAPSEAGNKADAIAEMLSDIADQQATRAYSIFKPIMHLTIGAIEGNHELDCTKWYNHNIHKTLCNRLGIRNLTDEACIRIIFVREVNGNASYQVVRIYIRHGYGSGRTPGAEPSKLHRMRAEWEWADVCLSGHTHTYHIMEPKPVLFVPDSGKLPTDLMCRYRFAANWGCWLKSHLVGQGSYESAKCYEAKPMMTFKVVVWPFWHTSRKGKDIEIPKVELREYPIL